MKSHAQAVVIGGGVIGCSILYHLAKLGWRDVVLLERDELTSGSTWHAAANIHGLHDSANISRLQHYTMTLYKELEDRDGAKLRRVPARLALSGADREPRASAAAAGGQGQALRHEFPRDQPRRGRAAAPAGEFRRHPLHHVGARWRQRGPVGRDQCLCGGRAAAGGGDPSLHPGHRDHVPQPDGTWIVETPKGNIRTPWVINAAGLWGREVAKLAGIELPLQPTEHQYFVTETIAEIAGMDRRLPSVADRDGEYYLRQEGKGLLIGAYERDMRFWAEDGTPLDFAHDLFPDDLERIEENMMRAIDRVPAVGEAGIKRVINGPMIWSPDANVILGPVPELKGLFLLQRDHSGLQPIGGHGLDGGRVAGRWRDEIRHVRLGYCAVRPVGQ